MIAMTIVVVVESRL